VTSPVLVVSNRGPVAFAVGDDGVLRGRRGGGGMISAVGAAGPDVLWVCSALSPGDRLAARSTPGGRLDLAGHDTGGRPVRMLDIDEDTFDRAYNSIANSTLWFVHHLLYDLTKRPVFDQRFRRNWDGFFSYNAAFADAVAEEASPGARVLVQDYHLALLPAMIRQRRPDLAISHFSHTPWAPPDYFRVLPDDIAGEVLTGLLGADHVGFLAHRWADAFRDCAREALGVADAPGPPPAGAVAALGYQGRQVSVGVHPLGVDTGELAERAAAADVQTRRKGLLDRVGGRRVLLRIDRTELSKNIVRGLAGYRQLLAGHREWRNEVVHLVFAYPSRHDLPEYREYTAEVQRLARQINDEFGTAAWNPVLLEVSDDYPRSLAAYLIADVLVVNPLRDGMNLVAKEGPTISQGGVALVLSREAGAFEELGADALPVNPFDVSGLAQALHEALSMSAGERAARSGRLAAAAGAQPPGAWLAAQLDALSRESGGSAAAVEQPAR
jgi:trehalose 6-phosphate synthase